MTTARTLAFATVAVLVVAAPASAAWDPPARASRGPLPAGSPDVAVNARGDAVAAWVRGARRDAAIVVSTRPAGQAWGEPVAISRRGRPAIGPKVAIDPQGRVVVVWRQVVRTRFVTTGAGRRRQAVYVARARERLVSETRWSPISTLSSDRHKVGPPEVGVDGRGGVLVAWHWGTGTSPADPGFVGRVQYVERPADGDWSSPRRLSRSGLCTEVRLPRVAVGAQGNAVVWWQCDLSGGRSTAMAVSRAPGSPLGAETQLPFRQAGDVAADLAVAPSGRAVAVSAASDGTLSWWRGDVGPALSLNALAALATDERIDADAGPPRVAVNTTGDALSAWTDLLGRPRAAPIAADLGVGSPTSLDDAGIDLGGAVVAVGDGRQGAVAWFADGRARAAMRAATGDLDPAATISGPGVVARDPVALAMDASGQAVALWTRAVGNRTVVERAATAAP